MPFHRIRHRYPPYWPQLAYYVKFEREKGVCQHCGAVHGEVWVVRKRDGKAFRVDDLLDDLHLNGDDLTIDVFEGYPEDYPGQKIVLTTAHKDHRTDNHHPDNLLALCAACHLAYDRLDNRHRFRENLNRKRGQLPLFQSPIPIYDNE